MSLLCGCIVTAPVYTDGSGVEIEWCALHGAASELLAACKAALADYGLMASTANTAEAKQLRIAIAKATGGKQP